MPEKVRGVRRKGQGPGTKVAPILLESEQKGTNEALRKEAWPGLPTFLADIVTTELDWEPGRPCTDFLVVLSIGGSHDS